MQQVHTDMQVYNQRYLRLCLSGLLQPYLNWIPTYLPLQSIEYHDAPINESQETKIHYRVYDPAPYQ